ncbi:peptidoglycan-binding protein [Streptomyces sp. NPDC021096]|uniref:peptidoglycan-binding protein n=1 Tax=Streptomyces sp. NPDC021096 TaxID=3154792 RepID=UPI0033E69BD3
MSGDTPEPEVAAREEQPAAGAPDAGLKRRRRVVTAVAAGAVLVTLGGVGAAAVIKSPAQVAAETAPPAPDTLTAAAERRVLADRVVTRGRITASQSVDVSSAGPSGKDAGRAVVTKVQAKAGEPVVFGHVLLEISGRPVFALQGALPAYRDLRPGAKGEDVKQLQSALASVGHTTGSDPSGTFGTGTERAVTAFYTAIGYQPVTTGRADEAPPEKAPEKTADKAAEKSGAKTAAAPTGPMVPLSEVVFLTSTPARAESVTAKVGANAGDRLMTLSAGELLVSGSLAPHERGLVRPGQKVEILSETTGGQATGTVAAVAKAPAAEKDKGSGQAPSAAGFTVEVKPDKPLPAELAGQEVRLTITAGSSRGEVLSVPSSAISAGADGRTTVTVAEDRGQRRRVEVRVGMSGDGYVEVAPVGGGRLTAGEQVVVGVETRPGARKAQR